MIRSTPPWIFRLSPKFEKLLIPVLRGVLPDNHQCKTIAACLKKPCAGSWHGVDVSWAVIGYGVYEPDSRLRNVGNISNISHPSVDVSSFGSLERANDCCL